MRKGAGGRQGLGDVSAVERSAEAPGVVGLKAHEQMFSYLPARVAVVLRRRYGDREKGVPMSAVEPVELSQDDFLQFLEERIQEAFGMSLEEFVAGLQDGSLDPESPRVAVLAVLVGARAG